ncbi:cation transporter [Robiginitomaculum antarcticum]|uniref:cation transporter n=1 Tax=Robiginitomaculum antarcticum TaxID=437507 RepID=UPI000362AB70|nr:cation diffusion facilitator family transporter [Robiginitomaculum antarcticum]
MSESCGTSHTSTFTGMSPAYKRALLIVIAINGIMFIAEIIIGIQIGSQALLADALDFGSDTATYGISLAVIGAPLATRSKAAMFKGVSLAIIALIVLGTTFWKFFAGGVPAPQIMGLVGAVALAANLLSLVILMRWRDGDANIRSVWLCSRNDAIGNVGVIIAGIMVFVSGAAWPDLVVAILLASLFLKSSYSIIKQARRELVTGEISSSHDCH